MRIETGRFRNVTILVLISLCFVIYSPAAMGKTSEPAIGDEKKYDEISARLDRIEATLAPLYLAGSYGLKTLVHESGHVLFASLAGASSASIEEYHFFWGSASYSWDQSPAAWQRLMAQAGGISLTRISAELTDLFLDRGIIPVWLEKVVSSFYLCARFDMPNYVLKSSFERFIIGKVGSGDDVFSILNTISDLLLPDVGIPSERAKKKRRIINILYATWLSASVLDLYLDFDEIKTNFYRMIGRDIKVEQETNETVSFSLQPMGLGFSYMW